MTYKTHDNDFIYIFCTATEAARLDASYVQSYRAYKVPITLETAEQLKNIIPTTLYAKIHAKYKDMVQLKSLTDTAGNPALRPYQRVDANILSKYPVLAVFNEQRTGKTPTILSAVYGLNKGLIVCPSSLKLNWFKEFNTWHNGKAIIISGSKAKRLKLYESITDETIIISYETLRGDIPDIMKQFKAFDYMIVDEAHRLRNFKTKQSKALFKVRTLAKRVYPMTGTPAVNHPADAFGILKLLYPAKYRSYWHFAERYFRVVQGQFGKDVYGIKPDRHPEFTDILYENSIQRKRREVMAWIPKVSHQEVMLEPTAKQLSMFKEIKKLNKLKEEELTNPLTKLLRLRQICVDPLYVGEDEQSPKFDYIIDYIEDNPDSRVIIFSSMTRALKRLSKKVSGTLLTGEQSTEEKQKAVDDFQSGRIPVLFANIKAGGVGFTLDQADTIIFLDKSYTPDENQQAADRFIPTDPRAEYGAKQVLTLLVNGSVERKIEQLLFDKINIISYVNDYGLDELLE